MGTRGIYGFYKDGVDKVTYNHFDSYPEELGNNIIDFIKTTSIEEMNEIFKKITLVEQDNIATDEQIRECSIYADLDVSRQDITDMYCLLRKTQGNLSVYKNGLKLMINNKDFIKDSLFCEWGYIINLTENVLEIYKGFQTQPNNNRYSCEPEGKYYNCAILKIIPLDDVYLLENNWYKDLYSEDE